MRCGPRARHIYPSLELVQPRKTHLCLTERLLMRRKESNQSNKQKTFSRHSQHLSSACLSDDILWQHILQTLWNKIRLLPLVFASMIKVVSSFKYEPVHEISNNVVCATSKASDQPAHTRSLIRAFASRLSIL